MRINHLLLGAFLLFLMACAREKVTDPCNEKYQGKSFTRLTDYVNPFIGTGGHGHTFPGATVPFGMVQLSPDTRLTGWDGCSGYHYSDSIIFGFSHTHLSGTGCSDYGDILVVPQVGSLVLSNGLPDNPQAGYGSPFKHENEEARPGYYRVKLDKGPVEVELTTTTRVGFHKYLFPETSQARLLFDLTHRDEVLASALEFTGENEVVGFRRSKHWAADQHVYFVARFSRPFRSYGIAIDDQLISGIKKAEGKNIKGWVEFESNGKEPVLLKVGISAVSIEGARKNLEAEIPGWNFEEIVTAADASWEKELSRITVEGGALTDRIKFYTALYHSFIAPNVYMDVDSLYRGRDLQVHKAKGFTYYTIFSLWDTYRTLHPLFTLVQKERTNDIIRTFLAQYTDGGMLPVWELSANETWCMIGYHSIPVIADAYLKGINQWDASLALKAMVNSARQDHFGLKYYKQLGYIPVGCDNETVSKTLEYAYDDWCIAQMAAAMGNTSVYQEFIHRAQYYRNVFDAESGFMRPRVNGGFVSPFDPLEVSHEFTEANSWQYSFYVPHDINNYMEMLGGEAAFANKLDQLFSTEAPTKGRDLPDITGLIGQYAHGNEPSHHIAYLYSYAGQAWKTQQMVRRIMDEFYTACPDGLIGNEDCGQMSAWLVMSALGIYPVTPASDVYVFGTPLFQKATLNFEDGRTFTIRADKVDKGHIYIRSAQLDGEPYKRSWISHFAIESGKEMVFDMSDKPEKSFGANPDERPFSRIMEEVIPAVPVVSPTDSLFDGKIRVSLSHYDPKVKIYFTTDGSMPGPGSSLYRRPLEIDKTTRLKACAENAEGKLSPSLEANFIKK
ncbi:MAG: glycoside hydrolase family 92 protein [Bacteroidales bacterium]|jgi:predicted alpha-1,2-mannosidase|nr:glycoside hydrolase family 92 protein [Bacteroidales bacterium]NPV37397.1 glycoside hydrolase family 92 protein [Bacteroidales bacterium]